MVVEENTVVDCTIQLDKTTNQCVYQDVWFVVFSCLGGDWMLRIAQVFNNSVVLVDLDNHLQAVAKGRGIAYGKAKGDYIDSKAIGKLFTLESETSRKNLYFLLKDIPIDVVTTTYEIIDLAQKEYHLKVLDYIYVTISDHINGLYQRYQAGKYQEIPVPDFHTQYPLEYEVARRGVQIINRNLSITIPESEANNLALHFINAAGEAAGDWEFEKTDDAKLLTNIVKSTLKKYQVSRANSNGDYYDRLMIHLQYLVDRIRRTDATGMVISQQMIRETEHDYPRSYHIASEIFGKIRRRLYADIGEDERFYFIVHIQRIIQEAPLSERKLEE